MRFITQCLAILATALVCFPALAQGKAIADGQTVTLNVPVLAVNPQTREVTLQIDGKPHIIKTDARVKNFDQIKAGDVLRVGYIQAVSVAMAPKADGRSKTVTSIPSVTADRGDKPGVFTAETTTVVARIESLDAKAQTATLEGPKGNYLTVHMPELKTFQALKAGDYVETTYSEAMIVEITQP